MNGEVASVASARMKGAYVLIEAAVTISLFGVSGDLIQQIMYVSNPPVLLRKH